MQLTSTYRRVRGVRWFQSTVCPMARCGVWRLTAVSVECDPISRHHEIFVYLCCRCCCEGYAPGCVRFAVKSGATWYHTAKWGVAKHKQIRGTCFDSHQKRPKTARKADASLVLAAQLWRLLESTTRCAKWLMFLIWTLGNSLYLGNPPPSNNAKMKFVSIHYAHIWLHYVYLHLLQYLMYVISN